MKLNAKKSFFAKTELNYFGSFITRNGIQQKRKEKEEDRGNQKSVEEKA
jgi:hypothetical protein